MHIILMLLLISLLIIVHELGHFLAAKAFGVQVSRFALGMPFGPTLFRKKFGETEFLIHAFFMGGYVTFPDDVEAEGEGVEGETEEPLPPDSPKRFKNKAPWQQAVIIASGVAANVLFALFLVFATALHYKELPVGEVTVKEIMATASESVREKIKPEDLIISVNGMKIDTQGKLIYMIQSNKPPLSVMVLRNGEKIELNDIYTNQEGFLGVSISTKFVETTTVKSAAIASYKYIYDNTHLMLYALGQVGTGKIPLKDLHGIVAITKVGGDIIQHQGLLNGLLLTAMISINLAVINLLPIPAVDGGHLMFLFLEKIRGRKFDEKTLEKINSIFFMALLALMVLIIFNDIFGLITKKF